MRTMEKNKCCQKVIGINSGNWQLIIPTNEETEQLNIYFLCKVILDYRWVLINVYYKYAINAFTI